MNAMKSFWGRNNNREAAVTLWSMTACCYNLILSSWKHVTVPEWWFYKHRKALQQRAETKARRAGFLLPCWLFLFPLLLLRSDRRQRRDEASKQVRENTELSCHFISPKVCFIKSYDPRWAVTWLTSLRYKTRGRLHAIFKFDIILYIHKMYIYIKCFKIYIYIILILYKIMKY